MKETPIINIQIRLERFPGKGGWTYAPLPGVAPDKHNPFGWIKVKGRIDDYYFEQYHLMPMGNGCLFLPVKAAVRKKINKQAGDMVNVELFFDDRSVQVPEALMECLQDEPPALAYFSTLADSEKKQIIDHIFSAIKEATQVERMAATINSLAKGTLPFSKGRNNDEY